MFSHFFSKIIYTVGYVVRLSFRFRISRLCYKPLPGAEGLDAMVRPVCARSRLLVPNSGRPKSEKEHLSLPALMVIIVGATMLATVCPAPCLPCISRRGVHGRHFIAIGRCLLQVRTSEKSHTFMGCPGLKESDDEDSDDGLAVFQHELRSTDLRRIDHYIQHKVYSPSMNGIKCGYVRSRSVN